MPFKTDKFVLALIAAIVVARIVPQPVTGTAGEVLKHLSTVGVTLIFFFYGLKLDRSKIVEGLSNYKLHIVVQATTFILFPLLLLAFYPIIKNEQQSVLWLGLFFMAAVPSTVTSSVVMVGIGKGNLPAAIFNASISGIIGVIITPLWMGIFLQHAGGNFDFTTIYINLFISILLPVIVGLLLQKKWHQTAVKYKNELDLFGKGVIVLIVYRSFAKSFADNTFLDISAGNLFTLALIVTAMFFFMYGVIFMLSRVLKFSREDRITALFCGSQKSLVHGTVFANVLFAGFHAAGVVLIPLMLFHSLQIFVISIIASKLGKKLS